MELFLENLSPDTFELLCRDGRRAPINDYRQCNWGQVPADAIVTSSARSFGDRKQYQQFLKRIAELYSDGTRDEQGRQGGQGFNNRNNFNDQGQSGPYNQYDNNDPYRTQNQYDQYRNERLDSSFSSERNPQDGTNTSILYEKFRIFESKRYGKPNLLFQVCGSFFL